ncbi:MAG: hypothetical protein LBQ51_05615, partial [Desulfovibrio sp.]|nr:hypothetical protein [Desulfovibrio sp.]
MGASVEYILGLRDRLNAAPHGDRRGMVTDAARLLGLSAQTVYRRLAAYGWTSGRKHRADKGTTCVPRELARLAGGMVHTATRANGKKTLPLTTACKILEADGNGCKIIPETGEVVMPDPSTVARIAKRHGCHPEQLKRGKPAIEMQSPHPNWCWQVDASVCTVFYLPKGKVHVIDDAKIYKNKPAAMAEAANEKVIRWVVTDHYSGAFFLRYSQGAEDTAHLLDAIIETMCRRGGTENDCLYGVPHIIMADKGSSVRSGPSRSLFDALNIKLALHTVGNPRAKGQVEQAQNLVETQFEGRLRMYTVGSLADLNAQADNWRIAYNLTVEHSRHKRTRHAMWRTITEEQLRIPASAEALRDLAMSGPMPVTVPHNLVLARTLRGYGRQEYDLRNIPGILPKMTLSMRVNPFRAPCVDLTLTDA